MSTDHIAIPIEGASNFYLVGRYSGTLGTITDGANELSTAWVDILRVVGPCRDDPPAADTSAACNLFLASPLRIPGALVNMDTKRLVTSNDLNIQLEKVPDAIAARFIALVADAARRMLTIDLDMVAGGTAFLGVATPFVSGGAFMRGYIKLQLWSVVGDPQDKQVELIENMSVALGAYARLSINNEVRSVALVVLVEAQAGAFLRIDADDLGLRFPKFKLPHFDLNLEMPPLDLGASLNDAESTLRDLLQMAHITITTDPEGDQPKLVLKMRPANKGIDWVIVTGNFVPTDDPVKKVAKFLVKIDLAAGAGVSISELTLGDVEGQQIFGGVVKAEIEPLPIPFTKARRFGPFELSWKGLTVQPSHQGNAFGGAAPPSSGPTLRAVIRFERLTLSVADDPDAFLSFKGQVEIDPSGVRLLALELVEPFPLILVQQAAAGMLRSAAAGITLLLNTGALLLEQLERLFDVLGRMALATGRAAIFLAEKTKGALDALADLLTGALGTVAEMLAALLKQLKGLALPGQPVTVPPLSIELRIATNPLELRQVLITLRDDAPTKDMRSVKMLGFTLDVPGHWQPGLLLDFVTRPGAYLVLTCESDPPAGANPNDKASRHVATLWTDLWLERTGQDGKTDSRPLRDVDGSKPVPPARSPEELPLLQLDLHLKAAVGASQLILVIAGLERGQTVFFQRMGGESTKVELPGDPGTQVRTMDGPFRLEPLDEAFDIELKLQPKRILALLGMGESGADPGTGSGPSFLEKLKSSLSNVVWVKDTKPLASLDKRTVGAELILGLKAAGLETSITLVASVSLDTLAVTLEAGDVFQIDSQRIEEEALGLLWVIEQADPGERARNERIKMFSLAFTKGQSGFELNAPKRGEAVKGKARMQLRFNGLSSDGQGVVFEVTTFRIGSGGLDLVAKVADEPVRLNGINVPFHFNDGALEIKGGRLVSAMIAGRGALPPDLIGEADCTVALTFGEVEGEGIVLQSGKVELDKKSDPIICHTTRFTLTISDLDIAFVKDGGYHFYYLVTGSLRFTPKPGEFESGLLQYLDGVEMNLERTPLSADPRVLLKHISFQKTLNPKKSFNLFNLFTFELRGFGFHPASPKFDNAPAVNISGQIKFVEIGDVMAPSIDFHGLWIAPPKDGESLPRIKADGLGIDLNLKGAIRVRGSVLAVDPDTRTVEGKDLAPPGYQAYGFLGRGEFEIPGWGTMGASLGFLELESKERPGERRKSFFFYANKQKLAIEIPTVVWNFYLREAGFGLGFRYTLDAIQAADRATSIPKLISALDEVSKTQGELHKFAAWKPEPEGDRVTLALKGAIQTYPANKTWDEQTENEAQNPFLFDLVAAIRSDFTLFMGLRGWVGTNYIDYLNDKDGLRANPGLRGYLYISAPQQRLLARMIGDSKGYIGDRIPALAEGAPLRQALQSVDWSATLFIKPGLFHYELGWPNQLVARLYDQENMRVTVRGGMIFRAAEDGLLWGYNVEADAFFRFGGEVQIGPVGVCAQATLTAKLVARVLCYLTWRVTGSLIYGLVALDAHLEVNFRAWLEVDLEFTSFTIDIGFSQTLQFSATVELAISTEGVGARVDARVAVSVFGCTLSVSVGFTIGSGQLDDARARVQRFLAMSITAEEPDAAPAHLSRNGDERIEQDAQYAQAGAQAPRREDVRTPNSGGTTVKPASQKRSQFGLPARETNFWCVLHQAGAGPDGAVLATDDRYGFALLTPKEAELLEQDPDPANPYAGAFYAPGRAFEAHSGRRDESKAAHMLVAQGLTKDDLAVLEEVLRYNPRTGRWEPLQFSAPGDTLDVHACWNKPVKTQDGKAYLTLALLFDECYLSDTEWHDPPVPGPGVPPYRRSSAWYEPRNPRIHQLPQRAPGSNDQERNAARDMLQRENGAEAAANPVADGVHQARSTVLSMFADQFVALAASGMPDKAHANVADLGLLFFGKVEALERLAKLKLRKADAPNADLLVKTGDGTITVFNPLATWFEVQDPVLVADRCLRAPDGVKLDWQLGVAFAQEMRSRATEALYASTQANPDGFLLHYEIVRTVEGAEFTPRTVLVKPAGTLGAYDKNSGTVRVMAPDWQYSDDLADLDPDLRRALLPANDDAAAMESALAWARRFNKRASMALSYTVTPVDTAGSRGTPRSFLVDVARPQPPLRPAEAELRFVIKRMGPVQGERAPHSAGLMPAEDSIAILIALRDPSRAPDPNMTGEKDKPEIKTTRSYRLVADPEAISPSGYYGSDGLTERRPGLAAMFRQSGDERVWELPSDVLYDLRDHNGKVPADTFIDALEPDHETLTTYPLWGLLAGATGLGRIDSVLGTAKPPVPYDRKAPASFIESLWRSGGKEDGVRIATRFSLETVQTTTGRADDGSIYTFDVVSKRVPVSVEVRIEPIDPLLHEIGLLRPDAFEWPVHLDLPPQGPGQVRATSGFARFRAPPVHGRLETLLQNDGSAVALVRDPLRRILTEVSFDAMPGFATERQAGLDAAHASSVSGFDIHELDLDDLAPLDTAADPVFAKNATTWRRARRVARIERVSGEMARLLPDSNKDWPGWQAHYPSETWRLRERARGRAGQSVPQRAPWYSAAESTVAFAARMPRLRLFPTASEAAVTDLMKDGRPNRIRASLVPALAADAPKDLLALAAQLVEQGALEWHALAYGQDAAPPHLALEVTLPGDGTCTVMAPQPPEAAPPQLSKEPLPMRAAQVRAAMMGLVLRLPSELRTLATAQLAEGGKLPCSLKLEARSTLFDAVGREVEHRCGEAILPLVLSGTLHPILEEVIGELEYGTDGEGLYRRYMVSVQPAQPPEAATMAGFLADSNTESDPYGWAALQQLGLAATIKLYDRDLDRFEAPQSVLQRTGHVLEQTVARYAGDGPTLRFGQPFVEVLLRPGRDRVPGPFDAVLESAGEERERGGLRLNDDALSIVQLSLRPTAVAVRRYWFLDLRWQQGHWPHLLKSESPPPAIEYDANNEPVTRTLVTTSRILAGYEILFRGGSCDLTGMRDGTTVQLSADAPQRLPLLSFPKGAIGTLPPVLALQFFLRAEKKDALPAVELWARVRVLTATTVERLNAQGKLEATESKSDTIETFIDLAALRELADMSADELASFPDRGLVSPSSGAPQFAEICSPDDAGSSPFERFRPLAPDTWAEALAKVGSPAGNAFASLRENLRFAAPALVWPGPVWRTAPSVADIKQVAAAYLPWAQRFLDHAAGPDYIGESVQFALGAPIKANPLNLAADSEGQLKLSFLHADRWAHARVYAVRPTPRYQNLALGVGYYESQGESEQLVTDGMLVQPGSRIEAFRREIGYALAVSPRTERIEPPVILGSRLLRRDYQGDGALVAAGHWELVVARHGEEALAFSNRPLFARLGTEGTALGFVREYRDPDWPGKFIGALKDKVGVRFEPYPPRVPALAAQSPDGTAGIEGNDLGELAQRYPSLWKGADVWRVGQLPAHYRVTALAVARAGLVVSRVVSAVQDASPRRALDPTLRGAGGELTDDGDALAGKPRLTITRSAPQQSTIHLENLRMVSHADLSEVGSHAWFTGGVDDVAWCPDPNVRYTLLRRGSLGAGRTFEDEDAELRLVAHEPRLTVQEEPVPVTGPVPVPGPQPESRAIVLRCQGTRFAPGDGQPEVSHAVADERRQFHVKFGLKLLPNGAAPAPQRIRLPEGADDAVTQKFNEAAADFAFICNIATIGVRPPAGVPATQAEAKVWLHAQAAQVRAHADKLEQDYSELKQAVAALKAIAVQMDSEADGLGPGPDYSSLERQRTLVVELAPLGTIDIGAGNLFELTVTPSGVQLLTLHDLPEEKEAEAAKDSGHPGARKDGGRLWQACRERLLGAGTAMWVRVVDTRNALDKTITGGSTNEAWIAPGVMETTVNLPGWTAWATQEN